MPGASAGRWSFAPLPPFVAGSTLVEPELDGAAGAPEEIVASGGAPAGAARGRDEPRASAADAGAAFDALLQAWAAARVQREAAVSVWDTLPYTQAGAQRLVAAIVQFSARLAAVRALAAGGLADGPAGRPVGDEPDAAAAPRRRRGRS
jgi:hypothetical protein